MPTIPAEDRCAIKQLVADYACLCDTKRYREAGELFAPDGVWDETVIGVPLSKGPEAIGAALDGMGAMVEAMMHINGNHRIIGYTGTTARDRAPRLRGDLPRRAGPHPRLLRGHLSQRHGLPEVPAAQTRSDLSNHGPRRPRPGE
jgi:hypothetical protein